MRCIAILKLPTTMAPMTLQHPVGLLTHHVYGVNAPQRVLDWRHRRTLNDTQEATLACFCPVATDGRQPCADSSIT